MRVLVLVLAFLVLAAGPAGAILAPNKGSQLVTLQASGNCPISGYSTAVGFNLSANSDGAVVPFSVPAKHILVLTDVIASFGAQVANDNFAVQVLVGSPTQGTFVEAQIAAAAANGVFTVTFAPPSGIAIKSGSSVCLYAINLTRGGFVAFIGTAHGFLAADK